MTGSKYYCRLDATTPDLLLRWVNKIIDDLDKLATKLVRNERGGVLLVYEATTEVKLYTQELLHIDSRINATIGKHGLEMGDIEHGGRVVRTQPGSPACHEADPDSIAIITPLTHDPARIHLATAGEAFMENNSITAGKKDKLIILPRTKFRTQVPYYLMVRSVHAAKDEARNPIIDTST